MQKVSVFNYQVTNTGAKACDIYIDNIIVDAETDALIKMYYGENLSASFNSIRSQIDQAVKAGCNIINVKVNCSGGNVFEAFAMNDYLNALQAKGITVNRVGIGLVASAATIIVSGPGSTISPNCIYMIHDASGGVYGTVSEVESYAVMIRKVNDKITEHFVNCTGKSQSVIANLMLQETYMIGQEAVDMGFVADCNDTGYTVTNQLSPENWIFQNKQMLQVYNSFTNKNKNPMDIKQAVQDALQKLGFGTKPTNELTAESVAAALDTALKPLVTNAIDDKVKQLVTDALKPETIQNAITEAVKNLATKEDLKDLATTESVKNFATKEDLKDLATAESVKNFVTKEDLKAVTDDVANLKSGEAGNGNKGGKKPENQMDMTGIEFQKS